MIYFMLLRLSPLFGTSLAEDPQKESSAFSKKHPRRFSYTPRACSIPYLSGTSFLQRHPTAPFRSVLWPLLHSALVQVLTIAQGIKNPDGSSGTSGQLTASRERAAFSLGAALAPRCGPFPVSQRSRLVNLHCSRSASSTISHLHSTRQLRLPRSPKLFPRRGCRSPKRPAPDPGAGLFSRSEATQAEVVALVVVGAVSGTPAARCGSSFFISCGLGMKPTIRSTI